MFPQIAAASAAGVGVSRVRLPSGPWVLLLDFLDQRFPGVGRPVWASRMRQGKVGDAQGGVLGVDAPFIAGQLVHYYRELPYETPIPFAAAIVFCDEHLLVADKPHFLPTLPAGRYVEECLLVRLRRDTGLDQLVPLHRLDRGTAGLVMFSVNDNSRASYSALFSARRIVKVYEALAPLLPNAKFPLQRSSRVVAGEPFFRMAEVEGAANAQTSIELIEAQGDIGRYRLRPLTGRKHQLRLHMAALGMPILNDRWYPQLLAEAEDDYARPLKLLARALSFIDPVTSESRTFESQLHL
ncbi:MAG: pseudouridine synthase [Hydrocarboniphaga sp.]|uniref:pseudouridine synthase n=1 Tax=Hydrocarboniphaga sp. TaxID=2033016 RepID=UPI00262D0F12|nr:pseudouridine synthase [Hydrocarboniphaga sp.]MDB5970250.1 pseudouridine synthase [Hydrocarboniphaga sp.]